MGFTDVGTVYCKTQEIFFRSSRESVLENAGGRVIKDFAGYEIDEKLLAEAPRQAVVMHCLPAYRGYEISDAVMEGPRSLVFPQAENRLHFQKGLLAVLMGGCE